MAIINKKVTTQAQTQFHVGTDGNLVMTATSSGNVGIGTDNPAEKLHIAASSYTAPTGGLDDNINLLINNSQYCGIQILGSSTGSSFIHFGDQDNADVGLITYEHNGDYMRFDVNATERMRIDSDGNVGIGDVPTSNATGSMSPRLFVDNNLGDGTLGLQIASYHPSIVLSDKSAGLHNYIISHDGGHFSIGYEGGTAGSSNSFTSRLKILSSGNVGIGTTVPARKLVIATDTAGDGSNLLLVNKNDTDGDEASIGFSMVENNTYVKAGIAFERTTSAGRGSLHFALNNSSGSDNVVYGTDDVLKLDADAKNAWFYGNVNVPGDKSLYFHTNVSSAYEARLYLSDYPSQGYTASGSGYSSSMRYWPTLESAGGAFIVLNTDGGAGAAENAFDSFVVWQGNRDGDKLFKVSNAGNTSTRRLAINSAGSETTFLPDGSGLNRVDLMIRSYTSGEKHGQVIACDNNGEAHLYMVDTANGTGNSSISASSGGWGLNIYYDGLGDYPYNLRTGQSGTWTHREKISFNGTREFMNSNLQHNDSYKSVQWKWVTTPYYWYAATTSATSTSIAYNGFTTNGNPTMPSNIKALYVTYYYHISGYSQGGVGQADHANDIWGPDAPSGTTSWSFTTSGNYDWGSAVFMHDGDASGSPLYFGAWYPGAIIPVNSNGSIYGLLGHGHSGGTHYHHMYVWGYAT